MSAPLVAVSFKAYLTHDQTLDWVRRAVPFARARPQVEVAVLPVLTALRAVVEILGDAGSAGAQRVSRTGAGAYTGEVPAAVVAECGGRYAEIAHAERRRHFGEGNEQFRAEVAEAVAAGLVPLVCVGESTRCDPADAAATCLATLASLRVPDGAVVAYEPEWAIGADEPAPAQHVRAVLGRLREGTRGAVRLLYGGTAGPGTWTALDGAADGLFLGRRAHDVTAFGAVLDEVGGTKEEQ
ncbi:triosephosphate isomerase [Cellulomonas sp. Sa3CUA2]|uniref:Triosephosphate isomerase n=1 Tax=Cellulomonas avistercoris TaxID=2762242 RepID=A0ABR8QGT7_9CELL|nr:triose-phosphate isomerase family protein [Cellulomonas avistercoris]MBD7919615.1 triosephosphate isomerase [Cellulomonas avistercoris]